MSNNYWSRRQESNLQPADYKSAALPIELRRHTSKKASRKPVCLTTCFVWNISHYYDSLSGLAALRLPINRQIYHNCTRHSLQRQCKLKWSLNNIYICCKCLNGSRGWVRTNGCGSLVVEVRVELTSSQVFARLFYH